MSLVVSRSWREFDKQQAIGLLSLYKKIWYLNPKFHFVINGNISDTWIKFVSHFLDINDITFYTEGEMDKFCLKNGVSVDIVSKFKNWKWIYHIVLYHYLNSVKNVEYLLTYDDDILFNDNNIGEVLYLLDNKTPFAIGETSVVSDKCMLGKLSIYFDKLNVDINSSYWRCYSSDLASNSGFMGLNNSIWNTFTSVGDIYNMFSYIPYTHDLSLLSFDYAFSGLLPEQSFLSVMNRSFSNRTHIVLREDDGYYLKFDMSVDEYSNSKIEHYLGITKYQEKYFNRIAKEFDALRHLFRNNLHISEFTYDY
jgi:hypothetical protein